MSGLSLASVRLLPAYLVGKIGAMDLAREIEAIRLEEIQPLPM